MDIMDWRRIIDWIGNLDNEITRKITVIDLIIYPQKNKMKTSGKDILLTIEEFEDWIIKTEYLRWQISVATRSWKLYVTRSYISYKVITVTSLLSNCSSRGVTITTWISTYLHFILKYIYIFLLFL